MLADVTVFHQFPSGNKWNPLLKHVKWADFLNLIYCFIIIMCWTSYILVKSCRTSCLSLLEPTPVIVTWIDWKHFYPCQMGCKFIAGYSLPCPALPPPPPPAFSILSILSLQLLLITTTWILSYPTYTKLLITENEILKLAVWNI